MDPWISPTIPYPVGIEGTVITKATGDPYPNQRLLNDLSQRLKWTYRTSPLGRSTSTGPSLQSQSVGKGVDFQNMIRDTYHPILAGNMSRTAQIIQAAKFGTGLSFLKGRG